VKECKKSDDNQLKVFIANRESKCDECGEDLGRHGTHTSFSQTLAAFIRHFAARVREVYPYCPPGREALIAEHACRKYSGRVGRSAAAKELDEQAVRFAVTAHVRHAETNYDELLSSMFERSEARMMVRDAVAEILEMWESEENGVTHLKK